MNTIDGADFERACLGRKPGESLSLTIQRAGKTMTLDLTLASVTEQNGSTDNLAARRPARDTWGLFGIRLAPIRGNEPTLTGTKFRGGLRVTQVQAQSIAARNGIREGDVLVGLDKWETISTQNVRYVLENESLWESRPLTFYVQRGPETLFGQLPLR